MVTGPSPRPPRIIVHVDMDAFFAAVEALDQPRLRGKPVIVGGSVEGHGVVSTASYEARRFGIRSAMPAATAVRLCPDGIFLPPRMERYAEVSRQVMAVLERHSPAVEQVSIDEAFVDLSGCERLLGPPAAAARAIQSEVRAATGGLTCSIGVAANKYVAKVASDLRKPGGLVVVPPGEEAEFLAPLPIERIWGVGPKTAERLHELGYHRIADLQARPQAALEASLGADLGAHLFRLSRGIDARPVETRDEAKSISAETTLATFLASSERDAIERILLGLCDDVAARLRRDGLYCRTVTLKVRDERFHTVTRSLTPPHSVCLAEDLYRHALALLDARVDLAGRRIRLLGVGASGLTRGGERQLDLFEAEGDARAERDERLARAVDAIHERLGDRAVRRGRLLDERPRDGGGERRL